MYIDQNEDSERSGESVNTSETTSRALKRASLSLSLARRQICSKYVPASGPAGYALRPKFYICMLKQRCDISSGSKPLYAQTYPSIHGGRLSGAAESFPAANQSVFNFYYVSLRPRRRFRVYTGYAHVYPVYIRSRVYTTPPLESIRAGNIVTSVASVHHHSLFS